MMDNFSSDRMSLWDKLSQLNLGLMALIVAMACVGFTALYSAAGGSFEPWASRQIVRFVFGFVLMIIIALIDIKWWQRLSYFAYAGGLVLLLAVEVMGAIGMGAQRWINLGFIQLQPSEMMKIATIMALAQYFHAATVEEMNKFKVLIIPTILILMPVALVMLQPDLGTALMIMMGGGIIYFLVGISYWIFGVIILAGLACLPIAWFFLLHDYQKERVLTFLDSERDPLGAGYHITQSKIALGSGGFDGKGFLNGTQSRLNFLPEKQTDFIFTLWAEEWGFIGSVLILVLVMVTLSYCFFIAMRCRSTFARVLAMGLGANFSLYVFINVAMIMGLIPVVGVPLPLISYGGTAMLTALVSFGLIMSANVHRGAKLPRHP
jgi:rod shape determining protein RodA